MKNVVIAIPETVVNDIQLADVAVQTKQGVIATFMESHAIDTDLTAIKSPVFVAYQDSLTQAKLKFEKKKDDMITRFVGGELQPRVASWKLNYNSCELSLTVND